MSLSRLRAGITKLAIDGVVFTVFNSNFTVKCGKLHDWTNLRKLRKFQHDESYCKSVTIVIQMLTKMGLLNNY